MGLDRALAVEPLVNDQEPDAPEGSSGWKANSLGGSASLVAREQRLGGISGRTPVGLVHRLRLLRRWSGGDAVVADGETLTVVNGATPLSSAILFLDDLSLSPGIDLSTLNALADPGVLSGLPLYTGLVVVDFPVGIVPEPATWALMLMGLGGLGAALRSRRKQGAAAVLGPQRERDGLSASCGA